MKVKWYVVASVVAVMGLAAGGGAYLIWKQREADSLPKGIVSINGRVEATQVDIATKIAGRVIELTQLEQNRPPARDISRP